ncbi:13185_t:CDS:2, partial [Funneliformis geosporum]
ESLNSSKLTKNPLRYWQTVLLHAQNLAEFTYRLFSIPPNSATSERIWSLMGNIHTERHNHSLKIYNELNNTDDDDISNGDEINVDEMIDDLE